MEISVNEALPDPAPPADDGPADDDAAEDGDDPATPDAGGEPPPGDEDPGEPDVETPAPATGVTVAACTEDGGGGCTVIDVAVADAEDESCVQLVLDDCRADDPQGLPVQGLPLGWRLASATVGNLNDECTPATFDPNSVVIVDVEGSISWDEEAPSPAELALDVTLVPSSSALDPSPVNAAGTVPGRLPECE
jgi:hypothetical protein